MKGGCNSEWPYEVTETRPRAPKLPGIAVAIANGRMRSLKRTGSGDCADEDARCNSEWPYEVTETGLNRDDSVFKHFVAIANGRMRSLKRQDRASDSLSDLSLQ